MKHRYVTIFVLLLCAFTRSAGQTNRQAVLESYVTMPGENMLLLTAAQPAAPIRFEDARLLMGSESNDFQISFDVRNVGSKPIRRVTAVIWTSFGTGGTLYPQPINDMLQPGEIVRNGSTKRIVTLTPELREKLKGPLRGLFVLIVEEVTFADGSAYSDLATSKALLNYFEGVSDKLERLENIDRTDRKRMPR